MLTYMIVLCTLHKLSTTFHLQHISSKSYMVKSLLNFFLIHCHSVVNNFPSDEMSLSAFLNKFLTFCHPLQPCFIHDRWGCPKGNLVPIHWLVMFPFFLLSFDFDFDFLMALLFPGSFLNYYKRNKTQFV